MSTAEAQATQETKVVTEQQKEEGQKAEENKEAEKKEDEGKDEEKKEEETKEEEKKDVVTRRRSSRISATTSATSNGTATKGKRGGGRPAKKRSAEEVAEAGGEEGKAKKAKKGEEEVEGLKLGEPLPDLTLKNEQGEEIKVHTLAENKKGVVLFLVPKADTPGCTTQACGFRDLNAEFNEVDFAVYCLSADAPDKQKKWKDKKSLPFALLSDPERALVEKLTGGAKKTARSHFVFAGGKLVDKRMPVKPADSPRLALDFIKAFEVGKTDSPEAIKAPDTADVAAASAAATAAVEPSEPAAATSAATGATEQTTAEGAPAGEAAQAAAPAS